MPNSKSNSRQNFKRIRNFVLGVTIIFFLWYTQQRKKQNKPETQKPSIKTSAIAFQKPSSESNTLQYLSIPNGGNCEELVRHAQFILCYNEKYEIPNWVSYVLDVSTLNTSLERKHAQFRADPLVKTQSASPEDYKKSGFDKGHMAPAADMKVNAQSLNESFFMSNVCPQHPRLNQGKWRILEEKVRKWAERDGKLVVITGPLIKEKLTMHIGENEVFIPSHFFKVILDIEENGDSKAIAFVLENKEENKPLPAYAISVDSLEKLSSYDFFSVLPDSIENQIEQKTVLKTWFKN